MKADDVSMRQRKASETVAFVSQDGQLWADPSWKSVDKNQSKKDAEMATVASMEEMDPRG